MIVNFEIKRMSKINFIEQWCDCDYGKQHTPNVKYIFDLTCTNTGLDYREIPRQCELTLVCTNGSCPSGYCNSTFGEGTLTIAKTQRSFTHIPIHPLYIDVEIAEEVDWENWKNNLDVTDDDDYCSAQEFKILPNNILDVSVYGGDDYYPDGYVYVNEELFRSNNRYSEKPFIYIFYGDSSLGKSYLGDMLSSEKSVYETDSNENLPDDLNYEIIVVGNKHHYSIEEIRKRITVDAKIVVCSFKELV